MIVEIVADAGHVGDHRDAERLQQRRRAEPRQLQKLRRVERARRDDHLRVRACAARSSPTRYSTPVARRPSNRMRVASASDTTARLARRAPA